MKRFRQYLSEAGSKGEAMEEVIIAAINGQPKSFAGIDAEAGVRVVEFLKTQGITGRGEVLGASQVDVSKKWATFWEGGKVPAKTKTPKTDFVIGRTKISLKTGGAAQLMSGSKNESLATFYTALEKSNKTLSKDIADKLTSMFEGLTPSSVTSDKLGNMIKNQKDAVVNKANLAHKQLMGELSGLFKSNPDFANNFAYEAMSGAVKFGGNDGTCTHFLVTDFDGNNNLLHPVSDKSYISNIAGKMKVSVRFKSSSVKNVIDGKKTKTGEYRYWSVVGLILDKMHEDLEIMQADKLLTEASVKEFFSNIWKKIKAFIKKAYNYIKSSAKNAFDFLGVVPEIRVNTVVNV